MGARRGSRVAVLTAADLAALDIAPCTQGVTLRIRVQPRGQRDELLGVRGGALKLRVSAPPVDGKANVELIALVAAHFGCRKSEVRIRSGASGRMKLVEIP